MKAQCLRPHLRLVAQLIRVMAGERDSFEDNSVVVSMELFFEIFKVEGHSLEMPYPTPLPMTIGKPLTSEVGPTIWYL